MLRLELRYFIRLFATFMTILAVPTVDADTSENGIPESVLQRLCDRDNSDDARRAGQQLWEIATDEHLPALLSHPHPNVALRAAWHRVVVTAEKSSDTDLYYVPSSESVQRFVGFVEGRLEIPLPDWWVAVVLQAQSYDERDFSFPTDAVPFYAPSEAGTRSSQNIVLERSEAELFMTIDGITLPVPIPNREPFDAVSGIRVEDALFIATHGDFPYSYSLWRLTSDGTESWQATVWAANEDVYYQGPGHQFVELVESGGTLHVFGATSGEAYVEAFNTEDGANLFRFSTSW